MSFCVIYKNVPSFNENLEDTGFIVQFWKSWDFFIERVRISIPIQLALPYLRLHLSHFLRRSTI